MSYTPYRICKGCKNRTPRDEHAENRGFCCICKNKITWCRCGCYETIPYYTTHGLARRYKNTSHACVGRNKENEAKRKISKAAKARWKDPKFRAKNVKGLKDAWKTNEERREKARKFAKQQWEDPGYREAHSGENHANWNPDKEDCYYGPDWSEVRSEIQERDNYTCQACSRPFNRAKKETQDLCVHHIVPFEDFNGDFGEANKGSNLICLCRSCHRSIHNGTMESPIVD